MDGWVDGWMDGCIEIIGLESSLCHVIGVHYVKAKW